MNTVVVKEKELNAQIGLRIKELREASTEKLTQTQLGKYVGLERSSISNIENGKQGVPLHVLIAICASLGVDLFRVIPEMNTVIENAQIKEVIYGDTIHMISPKAEQALAKIRN